jgi:hypothetical protein
MHHSTSVPALPFTDSSMVRSKPTTLMARAAPGPHSIAVTSRVIGKCIRSRLRLYEKMTRIVKLLINTVLTPAALKVMMDPFPGPIGNGWKLRLSRRPG